MNVYFLASNDVYALWQNRFVGSNVFAIKAENAFVACRFLGECRHNTLCRELFKEVEINDSLFFRDVINGLIKRPSCPCPWCIVGQFVRICEFCYILRPGKEVAF